jgi:hypothetical protein
MGGGLASNSIPWDTILATAFLQPLPFSGHYLLRDAYERHVHERYVYERHANERHAYGEARLWDARP